MMPRLSSTHSQNPASCGQHKPPPGFDFPLLGSFPSLLLILPPESAARACWTGGEQQDAASPSSQHANKLHHQLPKLTQLKDLLSATSAFLFLGGGPRLRTPSAHEPN